jgi:WD40 repeat protein
MSSALGPRIFISYARSDGLAPARQLRQRLEQEGFTLWQDLVALEGGRDWWTQIEEAIRAPSVEHLVLVVTPSVFQRVVVQREVRLARQEGVQVSPVIGTAGLDRDAPLPRWIGHLHDIEFPEQWGRLVAVLRGPSTQKRAPFMAPDLPEKFVPRVVEYEALKATLLDARGDAVGTTAALCGAGGYGKTVLANALCHDPDIQDAYLDGILRVELGERPDNLIGIVTDLIKMITGEAEGFNTIDAAASRLSEALGDRRYLLVIDDAWREQDLRPFLQGGLNTTRLVTTRMYNILGSIKPVSVDAMRGEEALALLSRGLPLEQMATQRAAVRALAARLGQWPLLLALVNSFFTERTVRANEPLVRAIAGVQRRLDARGLVAFDANDEGARNKAVARTIGVSLDLLDDAGRERFHELSIFPEDTDIPLGIVARLWSETGSLDEMDVEDLLSRLRQLSLVLSIDWERRTFRMHDIVRTYVRQETGAQRLKSLHGKLAAALRNENDEAPNELLERAYFYRYLPMHLADAGERAILDDMLLNVTWARAKLHTTGLHSLISDYSSLANSRAQELIGRTLDLAAGILTRDPQQFPAQLLGRLAPEDATGLETFLSDARKYLVSPSMVPTRPTFTAPGTELRRFEGHQAVITGLAVLDGRHFLSCSSDKTIRLWDVENGLELRRFEGHAGPVTSLVSLDDRHALSGSTDNTLRLWDVETGKELRRFEGHEGAVTTLAVLDGSVLSGSEDNTVRLWDLRTGEELRRFFPTGANEPPPPKEVDIELWQSLGVGVGVISLATTDVGRFVCSHSDKTLRLWDVASGSEVRPFVSAGEFKCPVLSLAALGSHRLLSGGSKAGGLQLWDVETGRELRELTGVRFWATCLAVLDKSRVVVGTAGYCDVEVWDVESGEKLHSFGGHSSSVTSVAVLDRRRLLSASTDRTIRLWDMDATDKLSRFKGLEWWVASFVVLDDRRVLTAAWWGALTLWDIATGEELRAFKGQHSHWVQQLTLLDPRRALSCGKYDNTLRLWDLETGEELRRFEGHGGGVFSVAVLDARHVISASGDKTLRLWDVETGAELRRFDGHSGNVNSVAVLDARQVISASGDKTLRLWDMETGVELRRFDGHGADVNAVAVLHAQQVISGSSDRTLRLWDAKTGKEIARFEGDVEFTLLAVMPDKRTVVARDQVARLHWIDILPSA